MSPARIITVRVFSELGHEGLPKELRPGDTITVDPGTRVQVAGITVICRPCGPPRLPLPADRRWARIRRLRLRIATWRHDA